MVCGTMKIHAAYTAFVCQLPASLLEEG
jgi:hypothetical protein